MRRTSLSRGLPCAPPDHNPACTNKQLTPFSLPPPLPSAQFGSNLYGTSKATIAEQTAKGKVVVLDIEMEGVKQVQRSDMAARYVFVAPPSHGELESRLRGRGTETEESIKQRLARAQEELAWAKTAHFDAIVTNDDLETAFKELEGFVYKKERQEGEGAAERQEGEGARDLEWAQRRKPSTD